MDLKLTLLFVLLLHRQIGVANDTQQQLIKMFMIMEPKIITKEVIGQI